MRVFYLFREPHQRPQAVFWTRVLGEEKRVGLGKEKNQVMSLNRESVLKV